MAAKINAYKLDVLTQETVKAFSWDHLFTRSNICFVHIWGWGLGSHDKARTQNLFINSVFIPFQKKINENQVNHQPSDEQIKCF